MNPEKIFDTGSAWYMGVGKVWQKVVKGVNSTSSD